MRKLNLILVTVLVIALLLIIPVNASLLVSTDPASDTNLFVYTGDNISVTFTGTSSQLAYLQGLWYISSGSGQFDDLAYSPTGSRTYIFTVPQNYAGVHNGYTRFNYLRVGVTDDQTHYAEWHWGIGDVNQNGTRPNLTASFNVSPITGWPGQTITCKDTTEGNGANITQWLWDVTEPDGNGFNFNYKDMAFVANKVGYYNISLKVWNDIGANDTETKSNVVRIFSPADIEYTNITYTTIVPDGWPVADVIIEMVFADKSTIIGTGTNPQGIEVFNHVGHFPGYAIDLYATKDGYYPSEAHFEIPNEPTYNRTIYMANILGGNGTFEPPVIPGFYNVTFIVQDGSGSKLPYIPVNFNVNERSYQGYTNPIGNITFLDVPGSSSALVRITAEGFKTYTESFSIYQDVVKTITLLPPSITVFLDVKDSTYGNYLEDVGVGIKNTTSGAWRNSTQPIGKLYFDTTGASFQYPLSLNETIVLAASKAGYLPASETLTIPSDQYKVTLKLININGTVPSSGNFTAVISTSSRATGEIIAGASVAIQELGRFGSTNGAGTITFRNLPVGGYTVLASATGYQSTTAEISGSDGDTFMKVIRLLPDGCSVSESGVTNCGGNQTYPGETIPGNLTGNEKAANGISVFLDHIIEIGLLILIPLLVWFMKKIFFS
jgi:hypothetical protein